MVQVCKGKTLGNKNTPPPESFERSARHDGTFGLSTRDDQGAAALAVRGCWGAKNGFFTFRKVSRFREAQKKRSSAKGLDDVSCFLSSKQKFKKFKSMLNRILIQMSHSKKTCQSLSVAAALSILLCGQEDVGMFFVFKICDPEKAGIHFTKMPQTTF